MKDERQPTPTNADQASDPSTQELQAVLGERVRSARQASGLSQQALADAMRKLGFTWRQTTVAKTEAADRPTLFVEVVALAGIFRRPVDYFFAERNPLDDLTEDLPISKILAQLAAIKRREKEAAESLNEAQVEEAVARDRLDSARARTAQAMANVNRSRDLHAEIREESSRLTLEILSRQEELSDLYGSSWRELLETRGISIAGLPSVPTAEYLKAHHAYMAKLMEWRSSKDTLTDAENQAMQREIGRLFRLRSTAARAADGLSDTDDTRAGS